MAIPYTYLLRHKPTGSLYYGVRFAKNCDPSEFWVTYFTSSKKLVPLYRTLWGDETFEFEIRRTFKTSKAARDWEEKVLRRMRVLEKPLVWLNRSVGKAILNETSPTLGRVVPEEQKARQRSLMTGKPPTKTSFKKGNKPHNAGRPVTLEEHQRLIAMCIGRVPWNKGLTMDDPRVVRNVEAMRIAHNPYAKGPKSVDVRAKISAAQIGIPRPYVQRGSDGRFCKRYNMHYANGRPAKNGDTVLQVIYNKPVFGVLYDATPGNDYCNGTLAPLGGGPHVTACLADCLRVDDVFAHLGVELNGDIREQFKKVPVKAE